MATPVVMPKQGQSVESCIIVEWKKQPGDEVAQGDVLCEVETDKAVLDVESPAAGTLLALFYQEGDLVPVLETIAAIGQPGEDVSDLRPEGAAEAEAPESPQAVAAPAETPVAAAGGATGTGLCRGTGRRIAAARHLAEQKAVALEGLHGSGPGGRVIERDVQAALSSQPRLSPVAQAMVQSGAYRAPAQGSGPGGRVMSRDLAAAAETPAPQAAAPSAAGAPPVAPAQPVTTIPLRGVRRVIADRMLQSMQSTAQLTLNSTADARGILAYRQKLKASDSAWGLQGVTINDLVLYAVSRILPQYPDLNALFTGEAIEQYSDVHLGFAVDTPRGLIVPVIRDAHTLTLRDMAAESRRLAAACQDGSVQPDELSGGTFTVTNLGNLGVESFTPILNVPQVAILGVGGITLKPVESEDGEVQFVRHLNLSLTINHQVVDGVHMLGTYAPETIWGAATVLETELTVDDLRQVVFPHPTVSEGIREAAWAIKND